ncbi:shikimate 5-dehydrogenase [Legionella geestiana]|uniref:Shikimate dehydrogenase (NADP(+)) n=1 Tax=Legionella geestiana TaxID=45065 RepID=A0A0W0TLS6_9GAMM|nr:shikimate dehydrogenase [Legionella geestiana]KTC96475.1 shikimate 5-dehydrogenase [Legionella geestiana]QBS12517.1 shikimate dehydrogenase [Legionella geestiana]QDQ39770.1 shikimate dehydrogenase [Legionella geestiana]STX55037.1 shikimate 5-dehydrogenase [Legionella geestiana]
MQRFAVIGHPVSHSLSPRIHALFAAETAIPLTYTAIDVEPQAFEARVRGFFADGGTGLNVTLPFKERAFAMADVATARATHAGSANTLWMQEGRLHADNTDGIGLLRDFLRLNVSLHGRILVLGAGGGARGILPVLQNEHPEALFLANRTRARAEALVQDIGGITVMHPGERPAVDVVINATSASLSFEMPDWFGFTGTPFCYDLAYSLEADTPFTAAARARGLNAADGLGMLIEQAAEAFYLWHGVRPDTAIVHEALLKTRVR